MKDLIQKNYFNRKNWILEEGYKLDLSPLEILVVLNIEHFNEFDLSIDLNQLSRVCNSSTTEIDKTLSQLINKGFLKIDIESDKVIYNTNRIYDMQNKIDDEQTSDIIEIFENEFKRPLSTNEIDKINYWLSQLDYAYLIHALREAIIYRKISFPYIERILLDWVKNNVTLEQLNAGKRNE